MKKIYAVLAILLLSVTSMSGITSAQNADTVQNSTPSDQIVNQADGTVSDRDSVRAADRLKRIEEYKQARTDRLTQAQEDRLKIRCAAAQEKVATLKKRVEDAINKRITRYEEISTKLSTLMEKLTAAGANTVALETAITEYDRAVASVLSSVETYLATLEDLMVMDCVADPSGFSAALQEARSQVGGIVSASNQIKDSAIPAIKAALKAIREDLAAADSSEG